MLQPRADAVDQPAVAERNEHRLEGLHFLQLDRDGPGALADRAEESVFDEQPSVSTRGILGVVEVPRHELHLRAERSHALDLQRVGGFGDEHLEPDSAFAARVSHALAEVARRRAYELARSVADSMQQVVRATALEAADGV